MKFDSFLYWWAYIARSGILNWIKKFAWYLTWTIVDIWCWSKPYQDLFDYSEYIWVDVEMSWHDHTNESIDIFFDGRILPFENGFADSILCTQVYEHIQYLDDVISESNRILKPGWYMLVTLPMTIWEHEQPYDFRRFTTFGITHELQSHWFEVVEIIKSWNSILTIAQLLNTYIDSILISSPKTLKRFIYLFTILPNTILALLLSKILPKKNALYLDNIVLAKKL